MSAKGRPEREYRSAKHEGGLIRPPGRPKGEYPEREARKVL